MKILDVVDSLGQKYLSGHINIGPVCIFGFNAMAGAINVRTRWGYVCFKPPTYVHGRWWSWYFYVSPNATPWASTFLRGPRDSFLYGVKEWRRAAHRRKLFGVLYDTDHLFQYDSDGEMGRNESIYPADLQE